MAWQPTWQLLVAFNNGAQDDPALITTVATPAGTLGATNVWTDLTPYLAGTLDSNRGRQHEVDKFQQGTLTATLLNNDGRFDSWNLTGPYTGKILPDVPVRLQGTFGGTTYDVFTGVVDVWATLWSQESGAQVQLQCVDWFSRFNYSYLVSSLYKRTVLGDGATGYWQFADPAGSSSAADSSGNANTATVSVAAGAVAYDLTFGNPSFSPVSADTSLEVALPASGQGITLTANAALPSGSGVTVEFWLKITAAPNAADLDVSVAFNQSGTTYQLPLIVLNMGNGFFSVSGVLTSSTTLNDGIWHYVALAGTNGGTLYLYIDGALVTSGALSLTGSSPTINFLEVIANSGGPTTVFLEQWAIYPSALSAGQIANHYTAAQAPQESSDTRLKLILNWMNIPYAHASIDAGVSQVQAISQPLTTTTILSYLQTIEQTEYGALFIDATGQVRFMSRTTVLGAEQAVGSIATFGDGGGAEIPFELPPQIALDTLDLYQRAQVTRTGGNTQTAGSTTGRTLQISGTLETGDQECLNYAGWLVYQFGTAVERIRSITIHPVVDLTGSATTAILGLELMKIVTVNRHTLPGGGTAFTQTAFVEGINHHIDATTGDWTVALQLTPVPPNVWVLGYSALGTTTVIAF